MDGYGWLDGPMYLILSVTPIQEQTNPAAAVCWFMMIPKKSVMILQVMLQFLDDLIHQIPQHTWQMAMIMARVAPSLGKRVQQINMDSVAREKAHF